MAHSDDQLRALARARYETGRWRRTAGPALLALCVTALALALGAPVALTLSLGAGVCVVAILAVHRGQGWDRGVVPGVLAGGLVGAAALLVERVDACCAGQDSAACVTACIVGGGIAGGFLVWRVLRAPSERRRRMLLSGGILAATTASMGCAVGGAVGLGGMLVALAALTAPALLWRPTRA